MVRLQKEKGNGTRKGEKGECCRKPFPHPLTQTITHTKNNPSFLPGSYKSCSHRLVKHHSTATGETTTTTAAATAAVQENKVRKI